MNVDHYAAGAAELGVRREQVDATAALLEGGATVPFISRYRKEATGELDEVAVTAVRDRLEQLKELDKRREAIVRSLSERDLLSPELQGAIEAAATLAEVEDLYLPFRPKRRTRATIARERGLEPLALRLFAQDPVDRFDPVIAAVAFVDEERGVDSAEEALAGARDIVAEWVSENAAARARLRDLFAHRGAFVSRLSRGKEEEGAKFRDYFDFSQPLKTLPSHRVLAMFRGENEGFLTLHLEPPEEEALARLQSQFVTGRGPASEQVWLAVQDSYRRLLGPSLETEARAEA